MKRHIIRSTFCVVAILLTTLALSVAPAAARDNHFSDTYDALETVHPCGFTVERHDVGLAHGRALKNRFVVSNAGVATLTNPANGLYVTEKYHIVFKNFNQIDNGDGTFTLDQTQTGYWKMYGPNGKVLLKDHGPITYHLVINPSAPEDEFLISQEILFEHGSHHDQATYCQKLTAAIGPGATP